MIELLFDKGDKTDNIGLIYLHLNDMDSLEEVREFLRGIMRTVRDKKKREEYGIEPIVPTINGSIIPLKHINATIIVDNCFKVESIKTENGIMAKYEFELTSSCLKVRNRIKAVGALRWKTISTTTIFYLGDLKPARHKTLVNHLQNMLTKL